MINKNLEELKKLNRERFFNDEIQYFVTRYLTPILEDFENRLKAIEIELGIYTEEKIKKIKVGGTDPD